LVDTTSAFVETTSAAVEVALDAAAFWLTKAAEAEAAAAF
jgi:hypothetical protein